MKRQKDKYKRFFCIFLIVLVSICGLPSLLSMIAVKSNEFSNEDLAMNNKYEILINNYNVKSSEISGKVHIDGDQGWQDFKNAGKCTGEGTSSDPYVIKNLEINGGGSGNIIFIENSNVHFKIENCQVISGQIGIRLFNVENGKILNSQILNNYHGIFIDHRCYKNEFINNTVNYNWYGVYNGYSDSSNNSFIGNIIGFNSLDGIKLAQNGFNNILSNKIIGNSGNGIRLQTSKNDTISGNTIKNNKDCGIHMSTLSIINVVSDAIITNNIFANNTNYGIYCDRDSKNNNINENAFLGNIGTHAYDAGTNNKWNTSIIGNYWEDYVGVDENPKDGLGDTPYSNIVGASQDYKPINISIPTITINEPKNNLIYGVDAPYYNISLSWDFWWYAQEKWYTLDGGENNTTFTELIGTIDQQIWNSLPNGDVIIEFYIKDIRGNQNLTVVQISKYVPLHSKGGSGSDNSNGDSGETSTIPYGNFYLIFLVVAIISVILFTKPRMSSKNN